MSSDGEADSNKLIKAAKASLGVGRLVDCTQADDRRMIGLVKERPLLYARSNMPVASYYSTVKNLWQEVADEMGWTVADVRRKWSHIRNSYSRHLRNEMLGARTCRGRMVSRWYLADQCDFLKDHMATDTSRPSPYSYSPSLVKMEGPQTEHTTEEVVELKPYMDSPWFALSHSQPAIEGSYTEDITINEDSNTSSQNNFTPEENCSFFQFFRGMYNDYQELPVRKQRLFKRKCLRELHDLLDAEDGARNSNEHSDGRDSDGEKPVIVQRND